METVKELGGVVLWVGVIFLSAPAIHWLRRVYMPNASTYLAVRRHMLASSEAQKLKPQGMEAELSQEPAQG
jgi:hypothetical protein